MVPVPARGLLCGAGARPKGGLWAVPGGSVQGGVPQQHELYLFCKFPIRIYYFRGCFLKVHGFHLC